MKVFLITLSALLIAAPAFAADSLLVKELGIQTPNYQDGPYSAGFVKFKNVKKVKFPVTLKLTPDCAPGIECPAQTLTVTKRKRYVLFENAAKCEAAPSSYQKKYFATITDASGKKAFKSVLLKCFSRKS